MKEPFCSAEDQISRCDGRNSDESSFLRDYATGQFNALLWISLIIVTALLLQKLIALFRLWSKARLIPGPPSPSFYGHSDLLSGSNITDLLSKSHEVYGSVVRLWLGPTQLLVSIKNPELIKEMLLKAEDKLPLTGRAFHLAFGRSSLFMSSFNEVQKRRDLLATKLNGKKLERVNVVPKEVMDRVMERIVDIAAKGSLDCKMVSQHLAFTILGATVFGDAFLTWSKANIYEELLMMIAKEACFWASYSVTPFWKQGFWRYQYLCTELKSLTQDIIQQCRQNYKLYCQGDENHIERRNLGGEAEAAYLDSHYSSVGMPHNLFLWEPDSHLNAREEPCGNILSLMFHGCLSTAGLIGNILARLAMHPEIQDKIHCEIIKVRKGSLGQDQHGVNKMLLLLATVYESARLLPAGPLLQRCSLNHDINLKTGVTIPAGAILVVPVQLVQTNNTSWGSDASQFNPYRFLSKAEKRSDLEMSFAEEFVNVGHDSYVLINPSDNAAFLPFGSGTRSCLGQNFAILAVALLVASLVEHYEIRLQPGSENDPKLMENNCILQLPPSPKLVFVRRKN